MLKVLLFSMMALAHTEHGAHVHGSAKMSIAFDGKKGKIELHSPSQEIYGFEYEAKSKADKFKKEQGLKKLEDHIAEMVVLPAAAKCTIKKDIFEVNQDAKHADVEAEFSVECETPVAGSITFNIQKTFPKLKKVQVDLLIGEIQKSVEVTKNGDSLELK